MSNEIQKKIDDLQKRISETTSKADKSGCLPTLVIAGVSVPIILSLGLYFLSPGFVKVEDGGEKVRSKSKVLWWTVGLTLVLWALMYGWSYYGGFKGASMICKV